jgi:hypothetical protein
VKKTVLALAFLSLAPIAAKADILQSVPGYARAYVNTCLAVVQTKGDYKAALAQQGMSVKLFGAGRAIDSAAMITASKKPGGTCALGFNRVGPNGALMRAAINAELAAQGYRPTGQTAPMATGSGLTGSGAAKAEIYSNGKMAIALDQSPDASRPPMFGIRSYSN